ncbi:MAG: hypothetical protein ACRDDX_16275 [Cellulosilyticaceae bacterium]
MRKKILAIGGACILLVGVLFLGARYGWRLFGVRACVNPDDIYIESVTQEKGRYEIRGGVWDSVSAFVGYTSVIEGEDIYIGLKYNQLLGFIDRNGSFEVEVDCDMTEHGYNIYIVDGENKKLIWPE